jgi:hypothetical protein
VPHAVTSATVTGVGAWLIARNRPARAPARN